LLIYSDHVIFIPVENRTKSYAYILFILFFSLSTVISINAIDTDHSKKVVIRNIETEISGYTRRKNLLEEINIHEGIEFENYVEMITFLDEAIQDLINMRVFDKTEYELTLESSTKEMDIYSMKLSINDMWSIYPIPFPLYTSNTGLILGVRFFYFNIGGTLTDFTLFADINIRQNPDGEGYLIPNWHITPAISGINILGQDFSLEYNQEYKTVKKKSGDVLEKEYSYHFSSLSLASKLYLPLDFYYTMEPSITLNYSGVETQFDENGVQFALYGIEDYKLADITWNHSLGYNNIDWIGNFRHGVDLHLSNALILGSNFTQSEIIDFSSEIEVGGKFFWRINKYFNFSSQIKGIVGINREMANLGENLRGIRNINMFGYLAAFLNIDLTICIVDWDGVGEILLRPFFDLGIVDKENSVFAIDDDFAYSTGADIILYIDKLNSIQGRVTMGIDLGNPDWSDSEKYELDLALSLSY